MEMLATPGLWLGLLIGVPAGMAVQHARLLVRSYRETQDKLPAQKEAVSKAQSRGAFWVLVVAAASLLVLVVLIRAN